MQQQMTMDGGVAPAPPSRAGFTPAQRDILRRLATEGMITSTDAGVIQHQHRTPPCRYCSPADHCRYASSDGNDAMNRLMRRGIVERTAPGVWQRVCP